MTKNILGFISGVIFALGLGISGMNNPATIIGFLDIFGEWNPSLILVMVSAISVYGVSWRFIKKRQYPILDEKFYVPTNRAIDKPLILGAMLFGIGFGLSGYCPGPDIVSIPLGVAAPFSYLVAVILGMYAFKAYQKLRVK